MVNFGRGFAGFASERAWKPRALALSRPLSLPARGVARAFQAAAKALTRWLRGAQQLRCVRFRGSHPPRSAARRCVQARPAGSAGLRTCRTAQLTRAPSPRLSRNARVRTMQRGAGRVQRRPAPQPRPAASASARARRGAPEPHAAPAGGSASETSSRTRGSRSRQTTASPTRRERSRSTASSGGCPGASTAESGGRCARPPPLPSPAACRCAQGR